MPIQQLAQSVIGGLWTSILNMPVIAIILFIVGILLLGVEIFSPGFGAAGISGLVCLFVAILFTARTVLEGLILSLILFAAAGILLSIVLYSASHGRLSKKLILREETDAASGFSGTPSYTAFLGKSGMALSPLRPAGAASIDGHRLDVVTEGEFLPAGTIVEVLRVEGSRIIVRQLSGTQ